MPTATALPLRAVWLMMASASLFALMAVVIRLASAQLHPFQITFFRSSFGALFALPLLYMHGWQLLRTPRFGFYVMRCVLGMGGMLAGFWAIVNLPLAEAIALSYSSPLFVTIGAVLFLGEVVRMRRWSAVVAGFIGVLVIVRPGSDSFTAGSLVALMAAGLTGAVTISIKSLTGSEPADRIVLLTTLLWVPLSLPAALGVWQWPHPDIWRWLILSGALGTGGHYCWTRALRLADASLLAPFSYLQLLVVAVLAWLIFGENVDRYTVMGAVIIIGASLYITHREYSLARRRHRQVSAARAEPTI
ncbi:DMT family transporter [Rhodanobacter glycinis]|uniref:DMT family transporter n=1 Tax=Rhodanobacter glycinis TaxID=582702 RepID=A0A502C6H7_9GAMM|nr:DMT family transporter [Rhodanobacter glycinis]TPG08413.1 DMT family transporter [Rhodanobacter glycinis]